jgi:hypothetical protein
MFRVLKIGGLIVVAVMAARWFGLTPERVADDTRALMSGDFTSRTQQQLRAEAARLPAAEAGEDPDGLKKELIAERQRIMEEKADTLEQYAGKVVAGDIDSLKRQVEENARRAGGGQ